MSGAWNLKRFAAVALPSAIVLALLTWTGWRMFAGGRDQVSRDTLRSDTDLRRAGQVSGIPGVRLADVPLALLCDYYDHVTEHAPPRDPRGVMQRREQFYRAPGDPFDLIRAQLTDSASDSPLRARLAELESDWSRGDPPSGAEAQALEALATQSTLKSSTLLNAGRGFDFVAGDAIAGAFFRASLTKAESEFKSVAPGDPGALPLLHQLDQTRALWRLQDYASLARRFALAAALYPTLSPEARRAGCLQAQALYNDGQADEAAQLILRVWEQDRQAGDLGAVESSDIAEMDWVSGLYLASARRYEEAIPYYRDLLSRDDSRRVPAVRYLISCLRHLGKDSEADELESKYHIATSTPRTRPTSGTSRTDNVSWAWQLGPIQEGHSGTLELSEQPCHG